MDKMKVTVEVDEDFQKAIEKAIATEVMNLATAEHIGAIAGATIKSISKSSYDMDRQIHSALKQACYSFVVNALDSKSSFREEILLPYIHDAINKVLKTYDIKLILNTILKKHVATIVKTIKVAE